MRTCTRFFDLKRDLVNYRGAKHQSEMGVYTRDDNGKVHEDGKKLIKRVTHLKNMFILKVCTLPITALFVAIGALFELRKSPKEMAMRASIPKVELDLPEDSVSPSVDEVKAEYTMEDVSTKSCGAKFKECIMDVFITLGDSNLDKGHFYKEQQ